MYKDTLKQLEQMSKMSTESGKALEQQMKAMSGIMSETLKSVPDKDKGEIESVQALMTRTINLAKSGKYEEAETQLNKFKNGRKNSK
jgi:TolA-binding protein